MICRKITLEAVSICVNYSDFLEEVIPFNLPHLDFWTIVTTPDDKKTQKLCHKYDLKCLKTNCFYRDTSNLNKARGINYGLSNCSNQDWVLHLDADIVLPFQFRRMLENAEIDSTCLYGMDRVNCNNSEVWDKCDYYNQYNHSCLVSVPNNMSFGSRIAHGSYGGYCPIGFFQLWNPRNSGINRYPSVCQMDMEHSDVLFAIQWDRPKRVLLPEGICYHLQSSNEFGANWKGRKTPPFRKMNNDKSTDKTYKL